jgi:alkylation response protein AidB-like acyl-CoA dehydrogenase
LTDSSRIVVVDFVWPPELVALREEAEAFGRQAAADRPFREDAWVVGYSRPFSRALGERGWLGMTWPIEEGGHGRPPIERYVVAEALISTGAPLAASWVGDRQIGPVLLAFGSPDQRRRYLPGMVAGTDCWCIGMSEPDAGSDLASLRTRAVEKDGGWVIEGRKVWTSFAAEADFCYLIARTDPDAPAHAGLSELIVPMEAAGIQVRRIVDMTGAAHFCEVTFDGVRVEADHLVGTRDGSWKQVMRQLEHERGGVDRLVSNRALFLDALAKADTGDPLVRQDAADLEGRFRIGRLLVLREVLGQGPPAFSAAAKIFCTELEQAVASFAARVMGPHALVDARTSRAVCYAPAYTIQGGTSAILRNVLGERALGLPR